MKLFLSAFEYAWAPFYFATMKEPDAKATFRIVTTYGVAVLVLLEAGLAAVVARRRAADDDARVRGRRAGHPVDRPGRRVPGRLSADVDRPEHHQADALLSGRDRRRGVRPASSATSLLVPRFGALGAAWANAVAYAVLAATRLRAVAARLSDPVRMGSPRAPCAGRRWARGLSRALLPASLPPLVGLIARGAWSARPIRRCCSCSASTTDVSCGRSDA